MAKRVVNKVDAGIEKAKEIIEESKE